MPPRGLEHGPGPEGLPHDEGEQQAPSDSDEPGALGVGCRHYCAVVEVATRVLVGSGQPGRDPLPLEIQIHHTRPLSTRKESSGGYIPSEDKEDKNPNLDRGQSVAPTPDS